MTTTPGDTLTYHGKRLNPEPISGSMNSLAWALRHGHSVVAQLEPGDGTHYCLAIIPAWAEEVCERLGRFGIRPETAHQYLIATYLDDRGGHGLYAFSEGTETWDMKHIKNGWTQEVFSWWFNLLWQKIRNPEPTEAA